MKRLPTVRLALVAVGLCLIAAGFLWRKHAVTGDASPSGDAAFAFEAAAVAEAPVDTAGLTYARLLREVVSGEGWSPEETAQLERWLEDPRTGFKPAILFTGAAHRETPSLYRHHHESSSISLCRAFIEQNRERLKLGLGASPVPLEIIVAILKVESNLGRWPAREMVFNVYWTLSLADVDGVLEAAHRERELDAEGAAKLRRRAGWARKELRSFMKVSLQGHYPDPLSIKGSWAGAFGLCQFIPSSYLLFAKDGDGDGVIDLDNLPDAVASIANYLVENGWPRRSGDPEAERRAILRYNRSSPYADGVLSLADSLRRR